MVTGVLSRVSAAELVPVTTDTLADTQKTGVELQQLLENGSSLQLQQFAVSGSTDSLYCNISTG